MVTTPTLESLIDSVCNVEGKADDPIGGRRIEMSERKKQIEEAANDNSAMSEVVEGFIEGAEWADANPPARSEVDAWAKKHGIGSKEEFLAPSEVYSTPPTVNPPSQDDERDARKAAILAVDES